MTSNDKYTDLEGREVSLTGLDEAERKLVSLLRRRAATHPNWTDFDNFWTKAVADFYDARGLTRKQSSNTAVFRIAQDLSSRLAVRSGMARLPDYRDTFRCQDRRGSQSGLSSGPGVDARGHHSFDAISFCSQP